MATLVEVVSCRLMLWCVCLNCFWSVYNNLAFGPLFDENEFYMKQNVRLLLLAFLSAVVAACGTKPEEEPRVEGLYTYEHGFEYNLSGNHFDVSETGTMWFSADGSALDSACQIYVATLKDGGRAIYEFNYVSPSRWSLDSVDFYFSGIKDQFRMEVMKTTLDGCDSARADSLARDIVNVVSNGIEYQYKFHLDSLTHDKLQWSFIYSDGHSDTWHFYRSK